MSRDALYVYGRHPVGEILMSDVGNVAELYLEDGPQEGALDVLVSKAKSAGIRVNRVRSQDMLKLVGEVNAQRIVAQVKRFKYWNFKDWVEECGNKEHASVLVLDKIEDVHNFGAIVRSAAAAGVLGVFVANAGQAPVSGAVFKTSAGAVLKVPIVEVANIAETLRKLKELGFWTYAVDMQDEKSSNIYTQEFDKKTALVVGGEGSGVSRIVRDTSDFVVHIPMQNNIESLNVSVAAALTMYEWQRQQGE